MRRILLLVAVVIVGLTAIVTAANGAGRGVLTPAPARVVLQPADDTAEVNPAAPASVAVTNGVLDEVTLTGPDGRRVSGALAADRHSWTTTEPLGYAKTYRWSGSASGYDGAAVPVAGELTTIAPATKVRGVLNIGDNRVVGVAAPVEIQFHGRVADKAAVQRALTVTTSVPTEGAWGWLPDSGTGSRVHWRPTQYWQPGTQVSVAAKLYGVHYGDGAYGVTDLSTTFTIGRAQVVKADVRSFQMVVIRDGVPVASYPASYGLDADPDRNTRSGVHVVTERITDKRMTSVRYQYDVVVQWAVRISNNGEFIHANPATTGVQGSSNVSHGCVNLSPANAKAYYDSVLYGDPVEVTGSGVPLSAADGDIYDWTFTWEQWQQLSAL